MKNSTKALIGILVTSFIYVLLILKTRVLNEWIHFTEVFLASLTGYLMCFYYAMYGHFNSGVLK